MALQFRGMLAIACAAFAVTGAQAQEKFKIGVISTMSGPASAFGTETMAGLNLALKLGGGALGGVPTELVPGDDQARPEIGKQLADKMINQDRVNMLAGTIFGQVVLAVTPAAVAAKTPYVSTVPGPSDLAGAGCNRYYFSVGYQTDGPHEVMGKYFTAKKLKNIYVVVPNFPAGKDAVAGLKRYYKEPLAGEVYTTVNQLDYSIEIAAIQAKKPEFVYAFLPGGMGINFMKQYKLAGLSKISPLVGPNSSFEEDILRAVGDSALGAMNSTNWAHDTANPENKTFVAAFEKEYKRLPTLYAAMAYDLGMLLSSALPTIKGKTGDKEALTTAIENAKFRSIRGNFKFNKNHMPIQDWTLRTVVRDDTGRVTNRTVDRIVAGHIDSYGQNCAMTAAK
jgi:branched-chain amino acid transport system substrate-binding protein